MPSAATTAEIAAAQCMAETKASLAAAISLGAAGPSCAGRRVRPGDRLVGRLAGRGGQAVERVEAMSLR